MTIVLITFVLIYVGMLLGGLPFLQLDRTGIAILGSIGLLVTDSITMDEAARAIHLPTLILLFSFMVVAAQLRLSGFYDWATGKLGALPLSPPGLLAALILAVGGLSAVFSNDVVCLSIAPVLIDVCLNRRLDPIPFLLGLACAANIGSAATLIGNPQNMLIGGKLGLSFTGYLGDAAIPVLAGLLVTWLVIAGLWGDRWSCLNRPAPGARDDDNGPLKLDVWQATKGLTVAGVLFGFFLCSDWPREIMALAGAGLLLLSRKLHSRHTLGLVDWQVLLLFIGLFIVKDTLERTGLPQQTVAWLAELGIDLRHPLVLFGVTFLLSNLVSNVPAIMLLLPVASANDGPLLALSSTFAGNLLVIGSVANIIVVDAAARRNIYISWNQHAVVGVPVTFLTLGISVVCLLPFDMV